MTCPPDRPDETATTERREVLEAVRSFLGGEPAVLFAYLFGSVATGRARVSSDVDIAVYLDPEHDLAAELRLQAGLARALGRRDVDLVVLNTAPLWLQFRILGEGVVAYSRDETQRVRHREDVAKRFLDFRPYHEAYLRAVRERARDRLSG